MKIDISVIQDMETEKRKVICKTLRFIAHNTGATLQVIFCDNFPLKLVSLSLLCSVFQPQKRKFGDKRSSFNESFHF